MGRAPFYLVFTQRGTFLKAVENPNFGKRRGPTGASVIDSIGFDEKGVMTGGIVAPSKRRKSRSGAGLPISSRGTGLLLSLPKISGMRL